MLIYFGVWNPFGPNLIGVIAASMVSFFGNAGMTFHTNRSFEVCAGRYFCISLCSLMMTSAIMAIVEALKLPTYVYVVGVMAVVPPTTFLLAKFWAFSSLRQREVAG